MNFNHIRFDGNCLTLLDQRKLPNKEVYIRYTDYKGIANAIKTMVVRGAPAIGVTAAFGIYIGAKGLSELKSVDEFMEKFNKVCDTFAKTRPTAVNLFWAINRMKIAASGKKSPSSIVSALKREAENIYKNDIRDNKTMGSYGSSLISDNDTVLTHCNAGALATAGFGTALGVIRAAHLEGKKIKVFADETRPFLQGARLTAWELMKDGIPVTLITDNMSAYFMKKGLIQKIVVGADRIAANGDTANKVGTYGVALLAKAHNIPFYVAAPTSTIDTATKDGSHIPIEERNKKEVLYFFGTKIAPADVGVRNPSFDVTPAYLITAIITEKGILKKPYKDSIKKLFK